MRNPLTAIREKLRPEPRVTLWVHGILMEPDTMLLWAPGAKRLGDATLYGYRREHIYCSNVVPDPEDEVEGVLWSVPESEMLYLDELESYPDFYDKYPVKVYPNTGDDFYDQGVDAIAYMHSEAFRRSYRYDTLRYRSHSIHEFDEPIEPSDEELTALGFEVAEAPKRIHELTEGEWVEQFEDRRLTDPYLL